MPDHPTTEGTGWGFNFPDDANYPACVTESNVYCKSVNYVLTSYTGPALQSVTMTFKVEASENTTFNAGLSPDNLNSNTGCTDPAEVTLMVQQVNDDFSHEFYRWFATFHPVPLKVGTFTVTVPLTFERWTSVGTGESFTLEQRMAGFRTALSNLGHVGMVFGGGCFAGHGVDVSGGTAQFVLIDYKIE